MSATNRNELCSCGSGKKYKKCCLLKNAANKSTPGQVARTQSVAPASELWANAVALYQTGKLREAGSACQTLLNGNPTDSDALHHLGLIAFQRGCHADASRLIESAIKLNPRVAAYHCNLGSVYMHLGQFDAAISAYMGAVRLDPNYVAAYNYAGGAFQNLGRLDEASVYLQKAIALKPDYADAHYNLGNTFKRQDKLDEATSSYRKAVSLKPDYTDAYYNLGNALKAQDKLDEATACYRKVLSLEPNFVEAHNNIGLALQAQGKLDEARACYRNALSLKPDFAEAHLNLGNIFRIQIRADEAASSYRNALAYNPNYAEAHYNLGLVFSTLGKIDEAMDSYRKALALKPEYAEALIGIGSAFQAQGRLSEALASYHKAIALKPNFAEAYTGMGTALRLQGEPEAATAHYQKALSIKPGYAEAHIGMAAVHIDEGRFETAQSELSKALESESDHPIAYAMLPSLRKMTLEDEGWLSAALGLTFKPTLPEKESFALQFAIGKYYDDTRQYDLAFSAYRQANALQRQIEGPFDRVRFSRRIDTLISTYTADFVNRQREGASQSQRPTLIVGMPRSGTSLTEQIIASHPQAFGAGELLFWESQSTSNPAAALMENLEPTFIAKIATDYEQLLQRHSTTAARIVDKMPSNFLSLGLIHAIFPQARIIHMQRNPIDTCLSIYFQHFDASHSYGTDLDDLAFFHREYVRLMQHWRTVLPKDRLLDVPYEALTNNQTEWSQRIIEFIGLGWDERCLHFHKTERKVGTSSNWQVKQKIYHSSKERWRHYEAHLGSLLEALGEPHQPIAEPER